MIPLHERDRQWMRAAWIHDPGLFGHSLRVAGLTSLFAAHLGLPYRQQTALTRAAVLHDIGKLKISDAILNKPSALDADEYSQMLSHPDLGYDLLMNDGENDPTVLTVVRDHHERLDGTGYPRRKMAADIPLEVRIVTLCDVYCAMTEPRPYAESHHWNAALEGMFAKRTRLDIPLLRRFATMISAVEASRIRLSREEKKDL